MSDPLNRDIAAVQSIAAVPHLLDVVCRTTGMGFAAVARVTEDRWIACSVLDNIAFGLQPGGELRVEITICHKIRQNEQLVVIDEVARHSAYPPPSGLGDTNDVAPAFDPLPLKTRQGPTLALAAVRPTRTFRAPGFSFAERGRRRPGRGEE